MCILLLDGRTAEQQMCHIQRYINIAFFSMECDMHKLTVINSIKFCNQCFFWFHSAANQGWNSVCPQAYTVCRSRLISSCTCSNVCKQL